MEFLAFCCDDLTLAVRISSVLRVVWAAALTSVPYVHESLAGMVNIAGKVIPVLSGRVLLGKPSKEMELSDLFIILKDDEQEVGLWIDHVGDVLKIDEQTIESFKPAEVECSMISGVCKNQAELILILDSKAVGKLARLNVQGAKNA